MGCVSTKDAKKHNLTVVEKLERDKIKVTKKTEDESKTDDSPAPVIVKEPQLPDKKPSLVTFTDDVLWAEVEKAFKMHDRNMDEKLSADEANGFIVQWCQEELGIAKPRQSLVQRTFEKIDRNKDM